MGDRVLIAPNAFKGTLKAMEVAHIIAGVIKEVRPNTSIDLCPIADGGDGTCELLTELLDLKKISIESFDPLGRPIMGFYGFEKETATAFVDVSTVSGVGLLKSNEIDAQVTSTFGTGKLIAHAIQQGAQTIVLGLGGSATVDLGLGILQALGVTFLNEKGRAIIPFSPDVLGKVCHIQLNKPLSKIKFVCLCDVDNTFFGEKGAIPVFGPQKGVQSDDFKKLETKAMDMISMLTSKTKKEVQDQKGFGAAGGIAFGLSFFFNTVLEKGASFYFEQIKINEKVAKADFIITGEGRYDSQSNSGKGAYELKKIMDAADKAGALISSGREGSSAGFETYIQLPDLDFGQPDFKRLAAQNLKQVVKDFLEKSS